MSNRKQSKSHGPGAIPARVHTSGSSTHSETGIVRTVENGLTYLLENWTQIQQRFEGGFCIFVAFDRRNSSFAGMYYQMLQSFEAHAGGRCYLATVASPPEYWDVGGPESLDERHYILDVATGRPYAPSDVHAVARHFDIPIEYLPATIVFRNLDFHDTINIFLGDFENESAAAYLTNLITLLAIPTARDMEMWRLARFLDLLPRDKSYPNAFLADMLGSYSRSERRNAYVFGDKPYPAHRAVHRVEFPRTVRATLTSLSAMLGKPHTLSSTAAPPVGSAEPLRIVTRDISSRVDEFRTELVTHLAEIDAAEDTAEHIRSAREQLHQQFDGKLCHEQHQLADEIRRRRAARLELPSSIASYADLLEDESRQELMTGAMIWDYLVEEGYEDEIDFAVCGIGLWKSLEIELNRTFIDALRVNHNIAVPGRFSIGSPPLKPGKIYEEGIFSSKTSDVAINRLQNGNLIGVELGGIGGLLQNCRTNSLNSIIATLPGIWWKRTGRNSAYMPDNHASLVRLADEVRKVANRYRNAHAHLQPMKRAICDEFRNYLLESELGMSPLFCTLEFKRALLDRRLI